jgi:hypothetical protein
MKKNIHTKLYKKVARKIPTKIVLKKLRKKIPLQEREYLALTEYFLKRQLYLHLWMDF